MTIQEALERLQDISKIHGYDVEIIFDCQHCKKETKPNKIITVKSEVQAKVT